MKKFFTCFVALLAIAAATIGPAWGQNSNVSWVLTPYGDLQTGDTVVIVDKDTERAMTNNNGSFSAPSADAIGLSGDQNSLSDAPAATLQWVVERDNGNYMFKVPGTSNYLYCTSDNDGVRVGSGNKSFEFQNGGTYNVPFLKNNATSRYLGLTNAYLWRCPSSISNSSIKNNVISFYKKTVVIIPTYTVRFASGNDGWTVTDVDSARSATAPAVLENVMAGDSLVATYSGTRKVKSVKAVKYVDPMTLPLTMEALTDGNIKVNIDGTLSTGMKYSVNGGAKNLITTTTTIDVAAGDKVQFYGNGTSTQAYGLNPVVTLLGTAQTKVYGNIMSLLDEDNFATLTALPNQGYVFYGLFRNNANLTDASGLLLPATTLANQCYYVMFYGCSSLTAAPALPATTLAQGCYNSMFQNCSTLTAAPVLPATTLAQGCYNSMFKNCSTLTAAPVLPADSMVNSCYSNMFNGCSSLTAAPALPSTTLALNCYYQMFYGCSSLTSAPVLPAQTLVGYCYYQMFYGCSSLTAAPALPATTLANHCYRQMFQNCSSLTAAPALPATTLANYCYQSMFQGCEALTAAPELPAQMLVSYCYYQMFYGCSNLNSVTCLATSGINQNNSTESWLNGAGSDVQGTKTFTADPNATWPTDVNGIPDGWARVNADE